MSSPHSAQYFLTVAEAAKLKGVSRNTIYNAIESKKLTSQLLLGRAVVKRSQVLAWQPVIGWQRGPLSSEHKRNIVAGAKRRWAEKRREKA